MAVLATNSIMQTFAVPIVNGTAAANSPAAAATPTSPTTGGATSVQLSDTGRLLSAAATFQNQLAAIHPGTASSATTRNLGTDFASLATEAQSFVDAFNQAETSIAGLQSGQASQFLQALNNQVAGTFQNGDTGVNTLAELGITQLPDGRLALDMNSLQAQFNANPAATFSLLTQAVQAFGTLAAGAQTGSQGTGSGSGVSTSLLNNLREIVAFQATLSLFNTGSGNTAPLGLATLLALEPLGQTGAANNNPSRQIAALSQFALVSSLLV